MLNSRTDSVIRICAGSKIETKGLIKGPWKQIGHEESKSETIFVSEWDPQYKLSFSKSYLVKVSHEDNNFEYSYFFDPTDGYLTDKVRRANSKFSIEFVRESSDEWKEEEKQEVKLYQNLVRKIDDVSSRLQLRVNSLEKEFHELKRKWQPEKMNKKRREGPTPPRRYGSAPSHSWCHQYYPRFSGVPPPCYRRSQLVYGKGMYPRKVGPYVPSQYPSSHGLLASRKVGPYVPTKYTSSQSLLSPLPQYSNEKLRQREYQHWTTYAN